MKFRFGSYEIDDRLYLLLRSGRPVRVRRQILDLLVLLVRNRERVLTRTELSHWLWPETTVGEGSLATAIHSARAAVGDDGTNQEVIATVHGRGYRFVAKVHEVATPESKSYEPDPSGVCSNHSTPTVICSCPLKGLR